MNNKRKQLRNYGFSTDNNTYIIAELGINHGGDVDLAKKLIDSSANTGVDAVKFQTYITEKRAPKGNSDIFNILNKCELPFDAFKELKDYSQQYDIDFISTPFDNESIDFLDSIGCSKFKIASFDVVNHQLLAHLSKTKKPVILSVGMSNEEEIKQALQILKKGTEKISLLHCISAYPCEEDDMNLSAIFKLQELFNNAIGLSDHTNTTLTSLYAVAAGAQIIEKHYKIDDNMDCIDAPVSITEVQMKKMVNEIRRIESIFGNAELGVRTVEKPTTVFRRYTSK